MNHVPLVIQLLALVGLLLIAYAAIRDIRR
jgi:hypothetical protein